MTRDTPSSTPVGPAPDPEYAVKTWVYLRLALIALVVGLAVSILFELGKPRGCVEPSISAYFYTPVHSYFVGTLIGMAVCLVCLRGSTGTEDVLLNLAGMFAPIVGFVPTPKPATCGSFREAVDGLDVNVANNVFALLALGALALVAAGVLTWRSDRTRPGLISYAAAVIFWVVTTLVFALARCFFLGNAHYAAAVLLFVSIFAVAVNNAYDYKWKGVGDSLKNRYMAIAGLMVLAAVLAGAAAIAGWPYVLIAIETAFIVLFGLFWGVQTWELRTAGLRVADPGRR